MSNVAFHNCAMYGNFRLNGRSYTKLVDTYGNLAVRYIGELRLSGFVLYDSNDYPIVTRTDNRSISIVVDLFMYSDIAYKDILRNTNLIEDTVSIENQFYTIFTFGGESMPRPSYYVISGDWKLYKNLSLAQVYK